MLKLQWAPVAVLSICFLLLLGVLTMILDVPMMIDMYTDSMLGQARAGIYKFMLFMTLFTGRGLWYIFLSTLIFSSLWDLGISKVFAIVLSLPVLIMGVVCTFVGWRHTAKLELIRTNLLNMKSHACPEPGMSKTMFSQRAAEVGVQLTKDELDYMTHAISEELPSNDGTIPQEKFDEWLHHQNKVV